jgi:hypothetical protein
MHLEADPGRMSRGLIKAYGKMLESGVTIQLNLALLSSM